MNDLQKAEVLLEGRARLHPNDPAYRKPVMIGSTAGQTRGEAGMSASNEMSGSEALFGFMAWLTTRESEVTFSAYHDAAPACELVDEFCKVNDLIEPREDWTDRLTHPT